MFKKGCILLVVLLASTGCKVPGWVGPGSDLSKTPQVGGYIGGQGAKFGSWVNNSWGPNSTVIPAYKDHPPLSGAEICVTEYPDMQCAITDASGRFDLEGIPVDSPVHLSIRLPGYYSLYIPFEPAEGDFINHPSPEIPATILRNLLALQLAIPNDATKGGMSFWIIDSPELVADPLAADHHEANLSRPGVALRYRQVFTDEFGVESFSEWSNPNSWFQSGHDIVYLNNAETPVPTQKHTVNSGLGLALNLAPGLYEIEADDTNSITGFGTLATQYHWDCFPINSMPKGSAPHQARAQVLANHLVDVRMYCVEE